MARARTWRGAAPDAVAMVLAGGRGERLQPLTRGRAKPALPFAGFTRIIDFTLANCVNSGVDRVHILTQYESRSVEDHVRLRWAGEDDAHPRRIELRPADIRCPGRGYRGTADAIRRNLDAVRGAGCVLVLGADHLYRMDYRDIIAYHGRTGAAVTIAAIELPITEATRMGVMTVDRSGRIRGFEEKPVEPTPLPGRPDRAMASMGIYVFSRAALVGELHSANESEIDFGRDVIPSMIRRGWRVFAFPFRDPRDEGRAGYWRDVGTLDSYFEAHMELLEADPRLDLGAFGRPSAQGSPFGSRVVRRESGPDGRIARSVVGPRSTISRDAHVEDSVLLGGVVVGRGATVRRAIVDERVRIAPGAGIGVDLEKDRRRFTVTDGGVVVIPRGTVVAA